MFVCVCTLQRINTLFARVVTYIALNIEIKTIVSGLGTGCVIYWDWVRNLTGS